MHFARQRENACKRVKLKLESQRYACADRTQTPIQGTVVVRVSKRSSLLKKVPF